MSSVDREVKGEPLRPASPIALHQLNRRRVFALLVEVAFRLHLPRLCKRYRCRFQLLLFRLFGGEGLRFFLPLFGSEHVPIDRIASPRQLVERDKRNVRGQANAGGYKCSGLARHWFQKILHGLSSGHQHRRESSSPAFRETRRSGCSGPRSPASTSGPHITANRSGLSARGSLRIVLGRTNSTVSPFFHVRRIST